MGLVLSIQLTGEVGALARGIVGDTAKAEQPHAQGADRQVARLSRVDRLGAGATERDQRIQQRVRSCLFRGEACERITKGRQYLQLGRIAQSRVVRDGGKVGKELYVLRHFARKRQGSPGDLHHFR